METSFKRSHACTATFSAPNPAAGHHQCMPLLETSGHSRASLGQSLMGSLLLFPGSWCTQCFVCALQESVSPVLYKFWQLYGGVNGDLLQEGLCHTQVCCTQTPCPCSSLLLTHTSTGDTQTQVNTQIQKNSNTKHANSGFMGSLGPGANKVCLSALSISGVYGVSF